MFPEKVCMLTSVHPPFDTRIFYKVGQTLVRAGYEVVLVAPHNCDEVVDGIRIRPVHAAGSRMIRMTVTVWHVFRCALKEKARVYHLHDPELIATGLLLKLCGKRVVYDVHEDLPRQILTKDWLHPGIRRLAAGLASLAERLAAVFFNGIIAATPAIAKRFPARKVTTIFNFPPAFEQPRKVVKACFQDSIRVVYAGVISTTRGAREMIGAVNLLPASLPVQLILAGKFSPPELEKELQAAPGWDRVDYRGLLPWSEVAETMAGAGVGLVLLHPIPNYLDSYPVKMFEYMAAGIPVIASNFPLWLKIIAGTGCGLLVDPLDTKAIAGAIHWIIEHPREAEAMGRRGKEAIRRFYNWESEGEKLLRFYSTTIKKKEGSAC